MDTPAHRATVRGVLVLLLIVALSAGAAAQQEALPKVTVAIQPLDVPIAPLAGVTKIPLTVTVDCALLAPDAPRSTVVNVGVLSAPSWAAASVDPSVLEVSATSCAGTNTTLPAHLLVSTTADAPAFTPAEVRLFAEVQNPTAANATATTLVAADFFPLLRAEAATTIQIAEPRTVVTFPVTVSNSGNAAIRVVFDAEPATEGWDVQVPLPITLESKQQGGERTSETLRLNVLTVRRGTYTNEVAAFTMRVNATVLDHPDVPGGSTTLSVLVTSRGAEAPVGWTLGPLALVAAGAVLARRRAVERTAPPGEPGEP